MKRLPAVMLAALCVLGSTVKGAPLDNRVPKDALIYLGWRGADDLGAEYANSNLKGVVETAGMGAYLQQQMPHWIDMAAEKDPSAPEKINDLLAGLNIAWRHPVAIYVGPVDFPAAPGEPKPRFAFLCDAGTDAPALMALLKKYAEKSPPPPEANLKIEQQGTVVLITVGASDPKDFAVHADALNTSPVYRGALRRIRANSALVGYADSKAILATIHEGVTKGPDASPDAAQKYDAIVGALGVSNLGEVVYGGGFDGKQWVEDSFIAMKGARTGLLSLLEPGPMDESILGTVPADAVAFSVVRFDFMKVFNTAKDVVSEIEPDALNKFNEGLAEANAELGFDIEKDFLATLGDHWVYYRWPSPEGIGLTQAAVHKLKDGDSFAKTLKKIGEQATAKAGGKVQLQDTEVDGIAVTQVSAPMVNFDIAVRNGYLYVSSAAGISAAVNQVEKKQPSIIENADYRVVRGSLPKVPVSSLEYANPAKIYPEEYRNAAMLLPFLGAAGINVPVQILPNPAKSAPYLTPGGSEYWTDDEGAHFTSRTALPGAGLLGQKQTEGAEAVASGSAALPRILQATDVLPGAGTCGGIPLELLLQAASSGH